ncbi:MAG: Asp-tRNA(Asn)/Glu-tRNA(Gln) amidotransferase subunit GatA [Nitrospinota bacterium]
MNEPIHYASLRELSEGLEKGDYSSEELTRAFLDRIARTEPTLNAYITVQEGAALEMARASDERRRKGEGVSPLTGIPIALKDLLCARGTRTTCGSKILRNFVAPYDATVVRRLREAGAVFLGKTNMDEFAMGSSNETSAYGIVKNPWRLECIPGGSSGGSASAVAAGQCAAALGSDTGGSIRQPAACCGIVGLKPTYGRVSRFGLVAFASSLDQIGPITRDALDAALLMNVIGGKDPLDSTSADVPVPDFTAALTGDIQGLRIGLPKEYFVEGMEADVEARLREAIDVLEGLGAEVREISLPHTKYAVATYYIIAPAEASSNLARYDGVRYGHRTERSGDILEMYKTTRAEGFGDEVKRRIMLGTYALSSGYYDAYYLKALKVRALVREEFNRAYEEVDAVLTATSPTAAFKIGEKTGDPLTMYLSDVLTISCNLAGIPGLSIPCGFTSSGLPVGLQLLGRAFDEETLLRVADAYQRETDFHRRRPDL